jgi:HSP20 family protein
MTFRNLSPFKGRKNLAERQTLGSPITSLQQEIDGLFEDFFSGWGVRPSQGLEVSTFVPRIDMQEDDRQIRITAELPGVREQDIRVTSLDDRLLIEGEKKSESEENSQGYYRSERFYGIFRRELPLPREIDLQKAEAQFENGVLTLTLPKAESAQKEARTIPIKKSEGASSGTQESARKGSKSARPGSPQTQAESKSGANEPNT